MDEWIDGSSDWGTTAALHEFNNPVIHSSMKIAVVGCGAVGSYYGAKLCGTGQDVHFLLRSDYDAVRREGVRVLSPRGDFAARPKCGSRPEEIGVSDAVLIALKTTANDQFPNLLPPL